MDALDGLPRSEKAKALAEAGEAIAAVGSAGSLLLRLLDEALASVFSNHCFETPSPQPLPRGNDS